MTMPTSVTAAPPVGIDKPASIFADITSAPCEVVWADDGQTITVTFDADLSPATQAAVKWRIMARCANDEALLGQAFAALQANRAFIALTTPTQAQAVAQVKALSRQVNALIRQGLDELDGTD
jgi:hypothetical protein